MVFQASRLVMS